MAKEIDSFVQKWIEKQQQLEHGVDISMIIPAYNEELRLPPTLIDAIDHFDAANTNYEIIVVDDGSTDNTSEVVKKFEKIRSQVKLIRLPNNNGKGHAVRTGMLNCRGKLVFFADADGASPIGEIERLKEAIEAGADLAIASRAMPSEDTAIVTSFHRKYLGRIFNLCVNLFLLPEIADTQCGFKLFTISTARFIFERQRSEGYSFDLEVLFIARQADLDLKEIPINWRNIPGSKVNLFTDPIKMFIDIFAIKFRHAKLGRQHYCDFIEKADLS